METKIKIIATGNRTKDFDLANAKFNFNETPEDYVWHHLDDYNVSENTLTMELVLKDAHKAALPHAGSCSQYDAVHGPTYNSYKKPKN